VKEALVYRKYQRAIELYEFKCDLLEKAKARESSNHRRRGPQERVAKGGNLVKGAAKGAKEDSSSGPNNTTVANNADVVTNLMNNREEIVFHTDLKIKKLKSYIKILQKHIESNFADPSGQDRSHKMKRMEDCRQLIDMLKGVLAASSIPVPELYPFQIITHMRSKRARCPLGVLFEIERDFGLAWGESPLTEGNSLDIEYYLESNHVRYNSTYPFAVAKELRVNIHDFNQPMKYLVLVAAAGTCEYQ
jgi:hypothetical protein